MSDTYLTLSMEAYDNLIKAAGLKASSVAKVCETQGTWSEEAKSEAPAVVEAEEAETVQTDLTFKAEPVPAEVHEELRTSDITMKHDFGIAD